MSTTSTSLAVRRVWVTVLRSLAFTTDRSTVMFGILGLELLVERVHELHHRRVLVDEHLQASLHCLVIDLR
jgi:hypothetical protein